MKKLITLTSIVAVLALGNLSLGLMLEDGEDPNLGTHYTLDKDAVSVVQLTDSPPEGTGYMRATYDLIPPGFDPGDPGTWATYNATWYNDGAALTQSDLSGYMGGTMELSIRTVPDFGEALWHKVAFYIVAEDLYSGLPTKFGFQLQGTDDAWAFVAPSDKGVLLTPNVWHDVVVNIDALGRFVDAGTTIDGTAVNQDPGGCIDFKMKGTSYTDAEIAHMWANVITFGFEASYAVDNTSYPTPPYAEFARCDIDQYELLPEPATMLLLIGGGLLGLVRRRS